ncbi:1-acyl-sn-glycerol-3-phosphate acyltransferase [Thalassovita mediterranea]|nr:1-acyl-sn-glycerol-3-phosphate acyltransferase [Thalassovita mediterranea]
MAATSPLSSARPAPAAGSSAVSWIWRQVCALILRVGSWKVDGDWPQADKVVLVAAPHTSNWDGFWMLMAAGYYRVKLRWMGKKSLVDHPLGGFIRWLGCVPVDRDAAGEFVDQMAGAFDAADRLVLAVAPEGTRAGTVVWKSGFYRIALRAKVPLLITVLDYGSRTITVRGLFQPTGDYAADLPKIRSYYAGAQGRHRAKFSMSEDGEP